MQSASVWLYHAGRMLEDLAKIEWGKLRHAYGAAADVPAQLLALASHKREVREEAWSALHGNLWHQETVYEATAYAVPLLIQLARRPDIPDRHRIVAYIGLIARGNSFPAVRQAVRQGASLYAGLLYDAEPRVRATAGYLLALLQEDAETHLGWIRGRLVAGEPDDLVRATLVLSVGRLAAVARHGKTIRFLEQLAASNPVPAVRITAALGLAWCTGAAIPAQALTVLIEGATEPHGAETIFHHVLYEDEDVWSWYGKALCNCGIHAGTVPAILTAIGKSDYPESIIEDLLVVMLADRPLKPGTHVADLTPPQSLALKGIGECDGLWVGADRRIDQYRDVSTRGAIAMLQYFGLPGRFQDFQAFVEGRARSASV